MLVRSQDSLCCSGHVNKHEHCRSGTDLANMMVAEEAERVGRMVEALERKWEEKKKKMKVKEYSQTTEGHLGSEVNISNLCSRALS